MTLFRNMIDGAQRDAVDATENRNPSDLDDVVGIFASASAQDTQDAIDAAVAALPSWGALPLLERAAILSRTAARLHAECEYLGRLLSREEGKTIAEGVAEVTRAAQVFDFFSAEVLRIQGEAIASIRPGVGINVLREAVGVIGIITPWNYPIAIPAWKIAPALAYGNTVVFKPADLVPASAWHLTRILHECGLPGGVLNIVMGKGRVVGQKILDSPYVNAITFTGSTETGRLVAQSCANHLRKVQLEMGGKNPLVVLDDADLDTAVDCAVNGAYYSTGQRCTASSRLIVQSGIHDKFVAAVTERMSKLTVGNALEEGVDIGPAASQTQLDQDLKYIKIGQDEGAELHHGGDRLNRSTPGHFIQPALFTETHNNMRICQEEIFGPVAAVIRVNSYEEALHVANDTVYGLSSGICTTSLKYAEDFKQKSAAGMVMVNLPTAGVDFHVPFGGRKASSLGSREQGRHAAEFFTSTKTAYTHH